MNKGKWEKNCKTSDSQGVTVPIGKCWNTHMHTHVHAHTHMKHSREMKLFSSIRLANIKKIMCKAGKVIIWIWTAILYIAIVAKCE